MLVQIVDAPLSTVDCASPRDGDLHLVPVLSVCTVYSEVCGRVFKNTQPPPSSTPFSLRHRDFRCAPSRAVKKKVNSAPTPDKNLQKPGPIVGPNTPKRVFKTRFITTKWSASSGRARSWWGRWKLIFRAVCQWDSAKMEGLSGFTKNVTPHTYAHSVCFFVLTSNRDATARACPWGDPVYTLKHAQRQTQAFLKFNTLCSPEN